jgi:hypothetical protein
LSFAAQMNCTTKKGEGGLDNAYHYNDNKGTVMINPTSQLLRKSTQGLLAGSAIMMGVLQPSPAGAQGTVVVNQNEIINSSAIGTQVYGNGNGSSQNSTITDTFTLNLYNALLIAGNSTGGAEYMLNSATVKETIDGRTVNYQGLEILIIPNTTDIQNSPSDYLGFTWGPNYN